MSQLNRLFRPIVILTALLLLALSACGGDSTTQSAASKLLLLEQTTYPNLRVSQFELASETLTPLFSAPQTTWINQIGLSFDQTTLAMSYTPQPGGDVSAYDRASLYLLDLTTEGAVPEILLAADDANHFLYSPTWTPDGAYLFYVEFSPIDPTQGLYDVVLMRYEFATGESVKIADDGVWPRVSADGSMLTYIAVDPDSLERGIVVADLDGSNMRELIPIGKWFDVDSPLFSPDGKYVYFTVAPTAPVESRSFWDWLTGVRVAEAHADHNVPSSWWRIPISDGEAERLTDEFEVIIYGAFDPSGERLYFSTPAGVMSMTPEGEDFQILAQSPYFRTLAPAP